MKRVAVYAGGGAKGYMQSRLMKSVEQICQRRAAAIFDLIYGTSVGGIVGGALSTGHISAEQLHSLMGETLPKVFKKRAFALLRYGALYGREAVRKAFERVFGPTFTGRQCATRFACTAVSGCDKRTHYFKSWEDKDGQLFLIDMVERTYAAPLYFGPIIDKANKQVWYDGGTGINNLPVLEAMFEAIRLGWANEEVHFFVVGTGYHDESISFDEAKQAGTVKQVGLYLDTEDGGLARYQARDYKIRSAIELCKGFPKWSLQYIDVPIAADDDAMDNLEALKRYEQYGLEMSAMVDYSKLQ